MADNTYEIIIVGGGPAGLAAAINGRIRNKRVLVLTKSLYSFSLKKAPKIDNYLGISATSGQELNDAYLNHARQMGVEIVEKEVVGIYNLGDSFALMTNDGDYSAETVIIATGGVQKASIPGEQKFVGSGVSYCATCDGLLYKGKKVSVIAYTPEAVEEANYLAEVCGEVYYIKAYREKKEAEGERGHLELSEKVRVIEGKPEEIVGDTVVKGVKVGGELIDAAGVFIMRETIPVDRLLEGLELEEGSIKVDRSMRTNIPGVFAAGDCTGRPWQVAKAVGEGTVAGLSAASYLDKKKAARKP